MRATVIYGAGDVRVENVPDARISEPTDALVTVARAAICGSDLWPYKSMEPSEEGQRMGHEFIGVVEEVGTQVSTLKAGDLVVAPFVWSDGTCAFCREGLQTSCLHGGRYGFDGVDGGQGEAVRVPQADGTLVGLPVGVDDELTPSLVTLTDVMATGHHAALAARVGPGKTVAVVGDGAVGLCAVIAARRLGAGPGRTDNLHGQRLHRRWSRTGARLHRGATARCSRRQDPTRPRLRPGRPPRRRAGRLPRDERARGDQGADRALMATSTLRARSARGSRRDFLRRVSSRLSGIRRALARSLRRSQARVPLRRCSFAGRRG